MSILLAPTLYIITCNMGIFEGEDFSNFFNMVNMSKKVNATVSQMKISGFSYVF